MSKIQPMCWIWPYHLAQGAAWGSRSRPTLNAVYIWSGPCTACGTWDQAGLTSQTVHRAKMGMHCIQCIGMGPVLVPVHTLHDAQGQSGALHAVTTPAQPCILDLAHRNNPWAQSSPETGFTSFICQTWPDINFHGLNSSYLRVEVCSQAITVIDTQYIKQLIYSKLAHSFIEQ